MSEAADLQLALRAQAAFTALLGAAAVDGRLYVSTHPGQMFIVLFPGPGRGFKHIIKPNYCISVVTAGSVCSGSS